MDSKTRRIPTSMSIAPELMERVRKIEGLNFSRVCQEALLAAVEAWESGKPQTITFEIKRVESIVISKSAAAAKVGTA